VEQRERPQVSPAATTGILGKFTRADVAKHK